MLTTTLTLIGLLVLRIGVPIVLTIALGTILTRLQRAVE